MRMVDGCDEDGRASSPTNSGMFPSGPYMTTPNLTTTIAKTNRQKKLGYIHAKIE
jgi:hypothetical protein